MFTTILCARYQATLNESHLLAIKRIFHYLKHTPNLGLWYPCNSEFNLVGYTYSDHGGCGVDRKSTSEGAKMIGDRLVSWSNKKQKSMACSTAEVEYVVTRRCCAQILWIQNRLLDYRLNFLKTRIFCDNTITIKMI